jgi:hypothetical protein
VFASGALISGLATPSDDTDIADDIPQIRNELNRNVLGHENAGTIALVNRTAAIHALDNDRSAGAVP